MKNAFLALSLVAAVAFAAFACAKKEAPAPEAAAPAAETAAPAAVAPALTAVADLVSAEGAAVTGSIVFTQEGDTVHVIADLAGVQPAGLHGIHLHETGDCTASDFTSAGGHFNPGNSPHGCPGDEVRHAGDFGNVLIAADGTGTLDITTDLVTVADGPNTVLGKAVILHAGEDDCVTQPTGNAGGRLACAIVEAAAEKAEEFGMTEGDGGGGGSEG